MATATRPRTKVPKNKPAPLTEIVAANLREIIRLDKIRRLEKGEPELKMSDLATRAGKSRQWVYRRTVGAGPITTDDIDILADALGVSTDELTRRP
jgi:hypothetical protein